MSGWTWHTANESRTVHVASRSATGSALSVSFPIGGRFSGSAVGLLAGVARDVTASGAQVFESSGTSISGTVTPDSVTAFALTTSTAHASSAPSVATFVSRGVDGVFRRAMSRAPWASGAFTHAITGGGGDRATGIVTFAPLNLPPHAPTQESPVGGATINRGQPLTVHWAHSDPDGDSQAQYEVRCRVQSTSTWTVEASGATSEQHTFAASTFSAGTWEWQARTRDESGAWGPWSASETFLAGDPPSGHSITSPAADVALTETEVLVQWTAPEQERYELRVVADDGVGAPNESEVRWTSGEVASASTRERLVPFPTNGVVEHLQLAVKRDSLWSDWDTVRLTTDFTLPLEPTIELFADSESGTITIQPTWQTPDTEPEVVEWGVRVRVSPQPGARADLERPVGGDGIRIATGLLASRVSWPDRAVSSGVTYDYAVEALGDNGAMLVTDWVEGAVDVGFYGGDYS